MRDAALDDAGNGLRGSRARPSPELVAVLREQYGIDATGGTDLGGSANLNLRVGEGRWVARVYRAYVTPERLAAIGRARRALPPDEVPCAAVLATREGKPWAIADGRLVEVEAYVESDAKMDSWERLEQGLPLLGRIHARLAGVRASGGAAQPVFANYVPPEEAVAWASRAARRIRGWEASPAELLLAERVETLAARVWERERDLVGALPRHLVHGDFWDNNVLFREGRVVLVTDFDFIGVRARIDDLALTLYFACATFAEDALSDECLRRLRWLTDAYDSGLEERLTREERAALPLALARQPLWAAGKWLALLDVEQTARSLAAEMSRDTSWALAVVADVRRWQAAFA